MSNGRFSVPEPKDKKEKEILIQSMPFLEEIVMFSEKQREKIHNAAMIAARSTNFDVELFEKELYKNLSSHNPQGNVFKKRNVKIIDDPIKHPSETSFSSGGIVNAETMRIVNELNSLPSSPNVSVAEMKEAFRKVNGMKEGEIKNEEGP